MYFPPPSVPPGRCAMNGPAPNPCLRSCLKNAAFAFCLSRAWMVLLIVSAHGFRGETIPAREERNIHPEVRVEGTADALRCVLRSADAAWYLGIAENGYDAAPSTTETPHNWVFFPLFPLLVRALSALGLSPLLASVLLSNGCFFLSLLLLQRVILAERGSEGDAARACWLAAFFPTSYFFSGPFTESIFLLLSLAFWRAVQIRRPLFAGLAFSLLAATRPTGALLIPAGILAIFSAQEDRFGAKNFLGAALMPIGALLFAWHLGGLTGDPLAFSHNQLAWGRNRQSALALFSGIADDPMRVMSPWIFDWLSLAALAAGLIASFVLASERRYALALWLGTPLLFGAWTGSLMSLPRFLMALFPIYLVLGKVTERSTTERSVLAIFAGLFTLLCVLYALHVTAAMT